jgi:hypothetical protein
MDVEVTSRKPVATAKRGPDEPHFGRLPTPPQPGGGARDDRERVLQLAWALVEQTNLAHLRSRAPPDGFPDAWWVAPLLTKERGGRVRRPARSLQGPPSLIQAASSILAQAQRPVSLTVGPASIALLQLCFRQSFSGVSIDPSQTKFRNAISAGGIGHALLESSAASGIDRRQPAPALDH